MPARDKPCGATGCADDSDCCSAHCGNYRPQMRPEMGCAEDSDCRNAQWDGPCVTEAGQACSDLQRS